MVRRSNIKGRRKNCTYYAKVVRINCIYNIKVVRKTCIKIKKNEKKSQLEIDFILNINGVVTALEVKSGNNKQSKSLNSIVDNYKTVSRYIKLERNTNIYVDELGIEHYPLFMIMFI